MIAPTRPDFSPAMLRLFLHARCRHAHALRPARDEGGRCDFQASAKRERDRLRRMAGVTVFEMDMAWMGRLLSPASRARLWAVLGHFPSIDDLTASGASDERREGSR